MDNCNRYQAPVRFAVLLVVVFLTIGWFVAREPFQASPVTPLPVATYSQGLLRVTIPYHALRAGVGRLTMEVLDPEDHVLARREQRVEVTDRQGRWQDEIKLDHALSLEDLVWHRLRYWFEYDGAEHVATEGTESISEILRRPVVHILGQQSYLTGGPAAVRVIVTDSKDEVIAGRGSVKIELLVGSEKPRLLFHGLLNRRGTTEAQFRFPLGLVGNYRLHYVAETPIGSTEFTQDVRLTTRFRSCLPRKSLSTNLAR